MNDDGLSQSTPKPKQRIFLVVVDDSQEMRNALQYACRRAQRTGGRLALLYVIEPVEFSHWLGVGRIMEADARAAAEQRLQKLGAEVFKLTGTMPIVHIREGKRSDEVVKLVQEDDTISTLVLATAPGGSDPGPIVTYVTGQLGRKLKIPLVLIPGELSEAEIDDLTY